MEESSDCTIDDDGRCDGREILDDDKHHADDQYNGANDGDHIHERASPACDKKWRQPWHFLK